MPDSIRGDSVPRLLLDDPVLVGMTRLALVVVALYGIASVPALIVGGRWAKGVGTAGVLADDASAAVPSDLAAVWDKIVVLELENARLTEERDSLLALMDNETRPDYDP